MIHYGLRCHRGHPFDGWFRSSDAFDKQAGAGELACPMCGSTRIERQLMAPSLASARSAERAEGPQPSDTTPRQDVAKMPAVLPDFRNPAVREVFRQLRKAALANSEHVGDRFPEEARKIHYRESEPRGIHGEATLEEAKALAEEGIDVHPLPILPEDQN